MNKGKGEAIAPTLLTASPNAQRLLPYNESLNDNKKSRHDCDNEYNENMAERVITKGILDIFLEREALSIVYNIQFLLQPQVLAIQG